MTDNLADDPFVTHRGPYYSVADQMLGSVAYVEDVIGASNTTAKSEQKWRPTYPSWREGFEAQ